MQRGTYVDDVVIKSQVKEDLISDLSETFTNLRRFRWKLNPKKCVFGVPSGKLLGFIVSYIGIEANPEKLKDIFRMNSSTKLKDIQKLTGCMSSQQFRFPTQGAGNALLQTPKEAGQVPMDTRSATSI